MPKHEYFSGVPLVEAASEVLKVIRSGNERRNMLPIFGHVRLAKIGRPMS